jgi:hypothetical protein
MLYLLLHETNRTFTDLKAFPLVLPVNACCRKGEHLKLKKERRWAKINLNYTQGVSEGIINILVGGSMDYSV